MRNRFTKIVIIAVIGIMAVSCSASLRIGTKPGHRTEKSIPPGQVKKITGEKSAKNYAPGHNKRK